MITVRLSSLVLCMSLLVCEAYTETVLLPFSKRQADRSIEKRSPGYGTLQNDPRMGAYLVNVSIGTPAQVVQVQVDTGSADLWVFGPNACDPKKTRQDICVGGEYDPSKSNSSEILQKGGFNITYGTPGSFVNGDLITDDVEIGGLTVEKQQFAVSTSSAEEPQGVCGIGFEANEASAPNKTYSNFVSSLVSQGLINSRSYSIYLDGPDENTGAVLFGGYDTEKYEGDLYKLPIQVDSITGEYRTLSVVWTFAGVNDGSGTYSVSQSGIDLPVTFDSGTTFITLPQSYFDTLLQVLGFENVPALGGPVALCDSLRQSTSSIVFGFGSGSEALISVPFGNFADNLTQNGQPVTDNNGNAVCQPAASVAEDGDEILFGDTFMKSAYLIYDLDEKYIYIAQASYSSNSNIIAIGGNSSSISASATGTATAAVTATGLPGNGGSPSQTIASTVTGISLSQYTYHPTGTDINGPSPTAQATSTSTGAAATAILDVKKILAPAAVVAVAGFIAA